MGWERRKVLAAVGSAMFGAGCLDDDDKDYEYPERQTPASPVLERKDRPEAPETETPTEEPTQTETPEDTETPDETETPDGETTPEPPKQYTVNDLENSVGWAENSLDRNIRLYNLEYGDIFNGGSVAATSPGGDEYTLDVSLETYGRGKYDDIGAYLEGSDDARATLKDELGHGLAYMISSTMKLRRAPSINEYFPANQPEGPPVITDATYRIYDNDGGEVRVDVGLNELNQAVDIIENTDGTAETWDNLYQDIIKDDMTISP